MAPVVFGKSRSEFLRAKSRFVVVLIFLWWVQAHWKAASLRKLFQQRETMPTIGRAMLLMATLTVALVCTTELELSELDSAAIYAGRRGGRLQTIGSFMVSSGANR